MDGGGSLAVRGLLLDLDEADLAAAALCELDEQVPGSPVAGALGRVAVLQPQQEFGRRSEWIRAGIFAELKKTARESYDRIVGLILEELAVDGCITKAPGGGECAGPSPVDRRKLGMKRSLLVEGRGIPPGRVLAPANRHDSPLLPPTLDKLDDLGPLPDDITVHLDAGYDSQKTRDELETRGLKGEIAHRGGKAPIQAGQRWHVERTNAWHNNFNRLQRCYERNEDVIDAFFDLADAIITVRRLIREAWTLYRWDTRPAPRP